MGLKEDDICEGVKLFVIVDIYDVMIYLRVYNEDNVFFKKEVVIEINWSVKG